MDKSQKQLIDTYFRKRNIAVANYLSLPDYEIVYALSNDIKINIDDSYTFRLAKIVSEHPEIIGKIDLNLFDNDDIVDILSAEKGFELYKHFDLRNLTNRNIVDILYNKPEYIDLIDINGLTSKEIELLLRYRPNLISKLDISKLSSKEIESAIFHHPELKKYFKNINNG